MAERTRPDITESLPKLRAEPSRVKVHEWSVEVSGGPDKGRKLETMEPLVRVGTDSTNDLVLTDGTVSRRHVEIERTPRGFVVRDLSSRNGVFLDSHQVLQAILQPGDKLSLGKTRLVLKQKAKPTEVEVLGEDRFGDLYGASEVMRAAFAALRRVAGEDITLMLEGETGTGKELAARAVHQLSSRRHGPFKVVDCNLLTEESADRELSVPAQEGAIPPLLETAIGGTLFLDEVAEIPLSVQPRLLRALDRRDLDLRIISSTHRNLDDELRNERFRKDLYFRLSVARVKLPPLRARKEELPRLAQHLVAHLGATVELTPQTLSLFESYDWPGNVRELRNVLERGALMQETGSTQWLDFVTTTRDGEKQTLSDVMVDMQYHEAKDRVVGDFERIYFAEVMKRAGFDIKVAEERTGLSMQSLYRLLKKNGLRLKDLKNAEGLEK